MNQLDNGGFGVGVVTAHEHVFVGEMRAVVPQIRRGQMVERADHAGVRRETSGFFGRAAVGSLQPVRPAFVEAERIYAADQNLSRKRIGERLDELGMAFVRYRDDDELSADGGFVVGKASH